MKGIIWLASYPKSGNTWFRIFLANLKGDQKTPVDINALEGSPIASARSIFDYNVGIEASDLDFDEIDRLRPEVYQHMAEKSEETLFMKVHDAYIHVNENRLLFPLGATSGAVYLIRNPLDVAVSFAYHLNVDYDTVISRMADENHSFCDHNDRLQNQLRQQLLSWSGHVLSWTRAKIPICVLRYEDMKQNPVETFKMAVRFLKLTQEENRIKSALTLSTFEELQRQEKKMGFREKSPETEMFFRRGEVGAWRDELTGGQARRIIMDHGKVMRSFGYLNQQNHVVF